MNNRTAKLLVVLAIAAVTLVFFYRLLLPGRLVYQGDLTSSDVTELNFPRKVLFADSIKHGSLPVWADPIGSGYPLLAEGQTGFFYPPNLLLYLVLGPVTAFNLSALLVFALAMIFTYLFARSLERSRGAALFSAFAFGLSMYFMSKIKYTAMSDASCWLPLALYGVEKLHRTRKLRFAALSGVSLAMQIFAGQTQIFYITALTTIAYFAFRFLPEAFRSIFNKKGRDLKAFAFVAAAFAMVLLVAVLLPAIQLFPSLAGIPPSTRASGVSFEEATIFPMRPAHLLMFVLPYHFGVPSYATYERTSIFWENCGYCGILTLILALIAVVSLIRRENEIIFWLGATVVALLIALGPSTPVFRVLWHVLPGMKLFRFPERFIMVAVLGLAVLAGRGLDRSAEWMRGSKGFIPRFGRVLPLVAVVILLVDLGLVSIKQYYFIDSNRLLAPPSTAEYLKRENPNPDAYRIAHVGQMDAWGSMNAQIAGWHGELSPYVDYRAMLHQDSGILYDIEDYEAQGDYGVARAKRLWRWARQYETLGNCVTVLPEGLPRMFGTQNVGYVVSSREIENEHLEPVFEQRLQLGPDTGYVIIYRNLLKQPRARVVGGYRVIKDMGSKPLVEIFSPGFDPSVEVLLEREPGGGFKPGGKGTARVLSHEPGEVKVEVETRGGGILVLADTFYPGWGAKVDGRSAEILRADYDVRAVVVPDGRHHVTFTYTPRLYLAGALVSLACVIALCLGALYGPARRRLKGWSQKREPGEEGGARA